MNYIELINHFWKERRRTRLTSTEADLYYFLMQESNIRGWENPLECSNALIAATIGVTEKTLIDARSRLQQKGLISFVPGQRKKKSPVYTLLQGKKDNQGKTKAPGKKVETKADMQDRFAIPTLKDVETYCRQRGNDVDAQKFIDFYTAKNWMIGKNKMKDWQAAVRTWEKNKRDKHQVLNNSTKNVKDDARW